MNLDKAGCIWAVTDQNSVVSQGQAERFIRAAKSRKR